MHGKHPLLTTALVATVLGAAASARADNDEGLYNRQSGLGVYHKGRLAIGLSSPSTPGVSDDGATLTGDDESHTSANVYFDVGWLGLPSQYGNWHGLETQLGFRSADKNLWGQFGTSITVLNLGRGFPGSLRVGGGFGVGWGTYQAYGYLRGRAAMVLLRDKLDVEGTYQWIPSSAGTGGDGPGGLEQTSWRMSAWIHYGKGKRAFEVFAEYYKNDRRDFDLPAGTMETPAMKTDEIEGGGAGIGLALW